MELMVDSQAYRRRIPECQLEIDACLRRNLKPPCTSRIKLICASDASPPTHHSIQAELVSSDGQISSVTGGIKANGQGSHRRAAPAGRGNSQS